MGKIILHCGIHIQMLIRRKHITRMHHPGFTFVTFRQYNNVASRLKKAKDFLKK